VQLEDRLFYRGIICSRIVLSDINGCRYQLLKKLDDFEKSKNFLIPLYVERRAENEAKVRLEAEQKILADEEAQRATEQVLKELAEEEERQKAEEEAASKIKKRASSSTRVTKPRSYKKPRN